LLRISHLSKLIEEQVSYLCFFSIYSCDYAMKTIPLLIVCVLLAFASALLACEEQHPSIVTTPISTHTLRDAEGLAIVALTFDPRGLSGIKTPDEPDAVWMPQAARQGAWDYREWQWWKGHPWGDGCRPRFHAIVTLEAEPRGPTIQYEIDGFSCRQQFIMPDSIDPAAPYWDCVISVRNDTGQEVEEYGQFFACYTEMNQRRSHWFWDRDGTLDRWENRGVVHVDGYVVHPKAYFLTGGAIPHCPRGDGKVIGTWHHPVLVSNASPAGWRSVILLDPDHTAAITQGADGDAMDYILFPGAESPTFAAGQSFTARVRHHLVRSSELPSSERLEKLWVNFENALAAE
jgi:hypothetical protein